MFDLVRYDSLRKIFILSFILHFVTNYQFMAPELVLADYSLSVYLNGSLIGFSELLGCILSYFIIDSYPRKKMIFSTEVVSFGFALLLLLFFSCNEGCSPGEELFQTVGLFCFRFLTTITYNYFCMVQYEVFPNQVRGLALQGTSIASCIAVVVVPGVMLWSKTVGLSIMASFGLSCLLAILFTVGLPETFGVGPPEMIEELRYEHQELDPTKKIKDY